MDRVLRNTSNAFLGAVAAVAGLGILVGLPNRSMVLSPYGVDRPVLALPVLRNTSTVYGSHSVIEISLRADGVWVATGREGEIVDLESFLRERAVAVEARGYRVKLRIRIGARAPAKHFVRCVQLAEAAQYGEIHVAAYRRVEKAPR